MLLAKIRRTQPRRGTTIVEVAVVLSLFLMFLFGIIEYCRYLFLLQITTNAARDAARYSVVSSSNSLSWSATVFSGPLLAFDPPIDSTRPIFNVPTITTYAQGRMAGCSGMVGSFQVRVFPADSALLYSDPVVIKPKQQTITSATWNNAAFTERIAVQIAGYYNPLLPNFLMMGTPIPVNTVCLMGSEG